MLVGDIIYNEATTSWQGDDPIFINVKGSSTKPVMYIALDKICSYYVWSGAKINTYSVCFEMVNGNIIEEQYVTEEEAVQRVNEVSNVLHVAYGRVKDGEIA